MESIDPAELRRRQVATWSDRWYQAYWALRSWLATAHGLGYPGAALIDGVLLDPARFEVSLSRFSHAAAKLTPPFTYPAPFVEEGRRLAALVKEAVEAEEPKENVYQAAVAVMPRWGWSGNHLHDTMLFRGESNSEWSARQFLQSIYRGKPDTEELKRRQRRLEIAAHLFREQFPSRADSDLEVLAILQHYALPTWLLDVTTSVYVALLFASGADSGQGVVYAFSINELYRHHEVAPELVPPIRLIKPRFVPRIDRQYGLFRDGGHGWSIRHLVLRQLRFRQWPGMRFEDPTLGVTEAYLLPTDGEVGRVTSELPSSLATIESPEPDPKLAESTIGSLVARADAALRSSAASAPPLDAGTAAFPAWPPDEESLRRCAERLLLRYGVTDTDRRRRVAEAAARFHRFVCEDPECGFFIGSLHAFIDAVWWTACELKKADRVPIDEFRGSYKHRVDTAADRAVLRRAVERLRQSTGTAEL
jgi:hypothetical protein